MKRFVSCVKCIAVFGVAMLPELLMLAVMVSAGWLLIWLMSLMCP